MFTWAFIHYLCMLFLGLALHPPAPSREWARAMASEPATLESLWRSACEGYLSPLEQLRAWALQEVLRGIGKPEYGLCEAIARKLTKVRGGHPSREALHIFPKDLFIF